MKRQYFDIFACSADAVPVFSASAFPAVCDCIVAVDPPGVDDGEPKASIRLRPAAVRSVADIW